MNEKVLCYKNNINFISIERIDIKQISNLIILEYNYSHHKKYKHEYKGYIYSREIIDFEKFINELKSHCKEIFIISCFSEVKTIMETK